MKTLFRFKLPFFIGFFIIGAYADVKAISLTDVKLAPEFSIGVPMLMMAPNNTELKLLLESTETSIPMSFGLATGLDLLEKGSCKLGFDTGIKYLFKRKIHNKLYGFSLEENFIEIPLQLYFALDKKDEIIARYKLFFGFDLKVLISSKYKVEDKNTSFMKDSNTSNAFKNNIENLKGEQGCPAVSGSIVFGATYVFPYGLYFSSMFKFPIEIFSVLKKGGKDYSKLNNSPKSNELFIRAHRGLSSSVVAFQFGIDMMKIFF